MLSRIVDWKLLFFTCLGIMIGCVLIYYLYTVIEDYRHSNDPVLLEIRHKLRDVDPVVDNLAFFEGDKSYTINKKKIYLCLKDENGRYYDTNMLMYVALHELAHVLCNEIGHTKKFHEIFHMLLDRAKQKNLYDPSKPIIQDYCNY